MAGALFAATGRMSRADYGHTECSDVFWEQHMKYTGKWFTLFLLGLATCASAAFGQNPGSFTATGRMVTPRFLHTATLLANGTVLIAGGFDDDRGHDAASAELYDPSTGTFTPTGNMITARSGHTATLLPNGTVLIAGGYGPLGSAEVYDPSTGTFSATGSMNSPRAVHTATLLADGRVLVAVGLFLTGNGGTMTNSAELYDPSTGTFTLTGSLPAAPYGYTTATLLPDGRVLISGGTAALYDTRTATFSSPQMPLFLVSAALLMNGKVLLAGGNDDPGESAGAGVYDPSTGTFTGTGKMTVARADDPATLLPDGTVLIAGSNGDGGLTLASAEVYDPATGTFSSTGDMTADRGLHTATLLNNGKVLIAGGIHDVVGGTWPPLSSAELYTPASVIPAPVLFSLSGDGQGQGVIWHSKTGEIASAGSPAVTAEALSMYTNNLMDGAVIPPQVIVGGRLAEILYFGVAPGYPGYSQVNFRVPGGVAPGIAVSVRLRYLARHSNQVTIAVQ
jgi:hypothetical protein